jgi:hypothetical protein
MLPVVVQYSVSTTSSTTAISLAGSSAGISGLFQLNGTYGTGSFFGSGVIGTTQQRITITSQSSDTAIFFHIIGLNQAGFTVSEFLTGGGAGSTVQSNLDYRTVISIQPSGSSTAQTLATTASTVSAGLNGVGSSLWNIVNWHVTPVNLEYGTILQSGAATWSIQYTYDDPNNLPPNVAFPQAFNHPTIVNATATIDGASNDPITAWRLLINSGTGVVRAIGIQAGIGGP